jgi:NAD-dependent deacetylase
VIVITQNIDDLHERAGSSQVIHLHGEILKGRPEHDDSVIIPWQEDMNLGDSHEGVQIRPHVVWFGEGLPEFDRAYNQATAPDVDVLIVTGTSLEVGPANRCAFDCQARTAFIVDPEPPELPFAWQTIRLGASDGMPQVLRAIQQLGAEAD